MKNAKLKEAIKEQGRSMKWVAMKSGIAEASLYGYISGKRNPSINNALKIAQILDLPVEQLFEIKIMGKK